MQINNNFDFVYDLSFADADIETDTVIKAASVIDDVLAETDEHSAEMDTTDWTACENMAEDLANRISSALPGQSFCGRFAFTNTNTNETFGVKMDCTDGVMTKESGIDLFDLSEFEFSDEDNMEDELMESQDEKDDEKKISRNAICRAALATASVLGLIIGAGVAVAAALKRNHK